MQKLFSKEGKSLPEIPWDAYPRPQLRRRDWLCLNGTWSLQFGHTHTEILVPFCPESLLSGVERAPAIGEEMIYHRSFSVPDTWAGQHILLHFGAVMRDAHVLVGAVEGDVMARLCKSGHCSHQEKECQKFFHRSKFLIRSKGK